MQVEEEINDIDYGVCKNPSRFYISNMTSTVIPTQRFNENENNVKISLHLWGEYLTYLLSFLFYFMYPCPYIGNERFPISLGLF